MARLARLAGLALEKAGRYRMPGLLLSLRRRGEPLHEAAHGFADLGAGEPLTASHAFPVGSVTKVVTAMAVMALVEDGLLSLDDDAGRLAGVELRVAGEPVRVWHLLSHTSGVPATGYAEALFRGLYGYPGYWGPYSSPEDAVEHLLAAVSAGWAAARPGERFYYLNEGYALLGLIVERVSGKPFTRFVRERILDPLGMRSSFFIGEEPPEGVRVARGYVPEPRGGGLRRAMPPAGVQADGGLVSTAGDLHRLLGALAARGGGVLQASSVAEMERARAPVPWQLYGGDAYGLGLMLHPRAPFGFTAGHGGSVLSHTAYAAYNRDTGDTVVALANASGYPLQLLGHAALAEAAGLVYEALEPLRLMEVLERVEGRYEGFRGSVAFNVRRAGWGLVLETAGAPGLQLALHPARIEEGRAVFHAPSPGGPVEVVFEWDESGRVWVYAERYRAVRVSGPG